MIRQIWLPIKFRVIQIYEEINVDLCILRYMLGLKNRMFEVYGHGPSGLASNSI